MSYSFYAEAPSKTEAKAKVAEKLTEVVTAQPAHQADREPAQAAADAFIDTLGDPADGEVIKVTVSGSLGWRNEGDFTHVNVSVSAYRAAASA